jgi:hypothetical protein
MRTYFIVFNQAFSEEVIEAFNRLEIRGFSRVNDLQGRGSKQGEPHMGSHTWPALNNAVLTMVEEEKGKELVHAMSELNKSAEAQGLRVFSWDCIAEV